jgi:preprotein translocase subunit SecD
LPKNLSYRAIIVIAVMLLAVLFLIPTMGGKMPNWLTRLVPMDPIHLGLDLQGGMHLILEVDVDEAVNAQVERNSQELWRKTRAAKIRSRRPQADKNQNISIVLLSKSDLGKYEDLISREFPDYVKDRETVDADGRVTVTIHLLESAAKEITSLASAQALEKIRNRVDDLGVAEPDILPQPGGRILLQLPGLSDPERAKGVIGKTALLEFKLVDDDQPGLNLSKLTPKTVPPGSELRHIYRRDRNTGRESKEPILLRKRTLMTGDTIADARVQFDSRFGDPYVSVSFDARGTRQFGDLTSNNVNKRLAIVMDGKVQSAPNINEPITGGQAMISGDFTMKRPGIWRWCCVRAPCPPRWILEERTVGPAWARTPSSRALPPWWWDSSWWWSSS